jgi:hypothetical protein
MTPAFTFVNTPRPLPCEVVAHRLIAMTAAQLRMGRTKVGSTSAFFITRAALAADEPGTVPPQ